MINTDERLSLQSDVFSMMRDQFDSVLNRTVGNMQMKGADEAVITVKMTVSTKEETRTTPDGIQDFLIPKFKHDISSVMTVKDKVSGELAGDYQLVWDEEEKKYVMRKIDDGQTSLYDKVEDEPWGTFADYQPEGLPEGVVEDAGANLYEHLVQFVGEEMFVTEAMGNYTLRRAKDNKIVLSSAVEENDPLYCDYDILEEYEGADLVCAVYGDDDGRPNRITIERIAPDADGEIDVMLTVQAPESFDEDEEEEYEYEEPEE